MTTKTRGLRRLEDGRAEYDNGLWSAPMTREDVDALPDGARVLVSWSGWGDWCASYDVRVKHGHRLAEYKGVFVAWLNRVGEHPLDEVRTPVDSAPEHRSLQ